MSVHNGHRQRLKERFCNEGLEHFDDLYILELLLFYCVTRKDTNLLAHRLLDRFSTLRQVLDASREELMKVEGVGEHTAIFLSLIRDVGRSYWVEKDRGTILTNLNDCGKYLKSYGNGLSSVPGCKTKGACLQKDRRRQCKVHWYLCAENRGGCLE